MGIPLGPRVPHVDPPKNKRVLPEVHAGNLGDALAQVQALKGWRWGFVDQLPSPFRCFAPISRWLAG